VVNTVELLEFFVKRAKRIMRKIIVLLLLSIFVSCASDARGWHGKWIQAEGVENVPNTWQIFRKEFVVETKPATLMARVAVDSKYWLWVNDSLVVFEGSLKRGPNPSDSYYDEIDIAPFLEQGRNVVSVLSWYFGRSGFSHNSSEHAALLFDAYNDDIDISSDDTWHAMLHPCYQAMDIVPNVRISESNIKYVADSKFDSFFLKKYEYEMPLAQVVSSNSEGVIGKLQLRPIPLFVFSELKEYEDVTFDKETRTLSCRLPYCAQVTPYLKVSSPANQTIDIYTDQDVVSGGQCVRGQYITRDGIQEYENLGWMVGHYIYYSIPEGVDVIDVKYRESGYDCDIVGAFDCSDDYINELWRRSARSLYVNMRDTYMDCPDRERAQWWGDVVNDIQVVPYVMSQSVSKLTDKAIMELIGWQRSTGVLYSPIPGNYTRELPAQMLMAVGQYGFYSHYLFDEDSVFISKVYDGVHKYLHDVWELNADGSIQARKGEWNWADWGDNVDIDLIQNCWYYLALQAESFYASKMGRTEDVADINSKLQLIKENFRKNFWTGSDFRAKGYTGDFDDRANALSVICGFVEDDIHEKVLDVLMNNYNASPFMEFYVFRALNKLGHMDIALDRLRKRYEKMMSYDYLTTLCETFVIDNGSVNHAWGAWIPTVIAENICGIKATSPGFRTFNICPNLANLEYANVEFETRYGRVGVHVNQTSINVTVPQGTQAHLKYCDVDKVLTGGEWSFEVNNATPIKVAKNDSGLQTRMYNLKGQQVDTPSRGVYINKGKKFIGKDK